ncbi:MAG: hypothetical protein V4591_00520 [Bdellovibrionota bacterium]
MDLNELEKQIVILEADQTLNLTLTVLAGIPYLKQDLSYVKSQLDKLG